jgi:hypothetical protein
MVKRWPHEAAVNHFRPADHRSAGSRTSATRWRPTTRRPRPIEPIMHRAPTRQSLAVTPPPPRGWKNRARRVPCCNRETGVRGEPVTKAVTHQAIDIMVQLRKSVNCNRVTTKALMMCARMCGRVCACMHLCGYMVTRLQSYISYIYQLDRCNQICNRPCNRLFMVPKAALIGDYL